MYNLVSRIQDGLIEKLLFSIEKTTRIELKKLLETHIHNQGLATIGKYGEAALNDSKTYVQTVLDYNALVMPTFNNDTGFMDTLDKACGHFINNSAVTKWPSHPVNLLSC